MIALLLAFGGLVAGTAVDPARAGAAPGRLVLSAATLKPLGWHGINASVAAGRRQVRSKLRAGADRAALAKASGEAAGAGGKGQTLRSYAFTFASTAAATRVVRDFERATGAQRLKVGHDGGVARAGSTFTTVFREGASIGVLEAHAPDLATATQFAPLADARLLSAPRTALGKVMADIRPDGTVSRTTALQAFALTFGSLPGVHPPAGSRGPRPFSGDLAMEWVMRYYARLSPRLRTAVDTRLGLAPGGRAARIASYGDPKFTPSPALTAEATKYRDLEAAKLGKTLGLKLVVGYSTSMPDYNDATPINAKGQFSDAGPICRIRVLPSGNGSAAFVRLVLAHEVFHCFEFDLAHNVWETDPAWVMEGLAEWAGLAVTQVPYSADAPFLAPYFTQPGTPIFARTYDAPGFWGHLEDTVGGLWGRVPAILHASTSPAAFFTAGAETEPFLSTWASSQVRAPAAGSEWELHSPISWPDAKQQPVATLPDNVDHLIDTVDPYSTGHVKILIGPLVHITTTGHARLSAKYNYSDLGDGWFCTESGGCECPAGSQGTVPDNQPLEPGAILALSGDPSGGATADIEAHTLKEFCSGVFVTQYQTAACVGCPSPRSTVLHVTEPGICTLGSGGDLTVTLTGDGGSLTITVPGFTGLPKRSDGATVFEFLVPRSPSGADVVMPGDWSSGDFLPPDVGIQVPQGAGHMDKNGKEGFLAVQMQSPAVSNAGRVAGGDFTCKKPVK
jgi:hypothetical protein